MAQNDIKPDLANKLTALVVPGPDKRFDYLSIYLDFGATGPGLGEIQIDVRLDKQTGTFIFDGIKPSK